MDAGFEQRVRERAYDIWMAAGMEDGSADLHWLTAERSVMSEAKQPKAKVAPKTTKGSKSTKPDAPKVSSASKSAKTKTTAVLNCAS